MRAVRAAACLSCDVMQAMDLDKVVRLRTWLRRSGFRERVRMESLPLCAAGLFYWVVASTNLLFCRAAHAGLLAPSGAQHMELHVRRIQA
eukprot:SAG25_NODE_71_length_17290_cov_41.467861_2_plen_90_part_00